MPRKFIGEDARCSSASRTVDSAIRNAHDGCVSSSVSRAQRGPLCRTSQMPFDLAERFINVAEDELGAPLPYVYRQAMMASNGGEVCAYNDVWNLHPILDTSDRKR